MSDPVEHGVQRWQPTLFDTMMMEKCPEGDYVEYADHVAAVQAERERIRTGVTGCLPFADGEDARRVLAVIDGGDGE